MDEGQTDRGVRYEPKDIRLGCLLAVMAAGILVMVSVGGGIWWFFWWQAGVERVENQSPYPLEPALSQPLPPEPRLEQINRMAGVESSDVTQRLAAQEKVLNSYGPTDEKGFVHIPIQQAIKAVAGHLPVAKRSPAQSGHASGLVDSGESNSGRMFRRMSP